MICRRLVYGPSQANTFAFAVFSALHGACKSRHIVRAARDRVGSIIADCLRFVGELSNRMAHAGARVLVSFGCGGAEMFGGVCHVSSEICAGTWCESQRQYCADEPARDESHRKAGAWRILPARVRCYMIRYIISHVCTITRRRGKSCSQQDTSVAQLRLDLLVQVHVKLGGCGQDGDPRNLFEAADVFACLRQR